MGCPALTPNGCSYYLRTDDDFEGIIFVELIKDALSLINRQKAEIEVLEMHLEEAHIDIKERLEEIDMLDKNLCDAEAEIEDVKRRCDVALSLMERKEECIKTEAIKEFAKRCASVLRPLCYNNDQYYLMDEAIYNLVKEMLGDRDAG